MAEQARKNKREKAEIQVGTGSRRGLAFVFMGAHFPLLNNADLFQWKRPFGFNLRELPDLLTLGSWYLIYAFPGIMVAVVIYSVPLYLVLRKLNRNRASDKKGDLVKFCIIGFLVSSPLSLAGMIKFFVGLAHFKFDLDTLSLSLLFLGQGLLLGVTMFLQRKIDRASRRVFPSNRPIALLFAISAGFFLHYLAFLMYIMPLFGLWIVAFGKSDQGLAILFLVPWGFVMSLVVAVINSMTYQSQSLKIVETRC